MTNNDPIIFVISENHPKQIPIYWINIPHKNEERPIICLIEIMRDVTGFIEITRDVAGFMRTRGRQPSQAREANPGLIMLRPYRPRLSAY